jgi:hypothetical protein
MCFGFPIAGQVFGQVLKFCVIAKRRLVRPAAGSAPTHRIAAPPD